MIRNVTILALAISLALPGTAHSSEIVEARRSVAEFGRCIATNNPAQAARAVVEHWDREAMRNDKLFKSSRHCLWTQGYAMLWTSSAQVKAAMAEALVLREKLTVANPRALAPLAYRYPTPLETLDRKGKSLPEKAIAAQREAIAGKLSVIIGEKIGECLVRADPEGARALLVTTVGADAEKAALNVLAPKLPTCIDKGMTIELTRASLRGVVALAYYRLAKAEAGTVWAGETD